MPADLGNFELSSRQVVTPAGVRAATIGVRNGVIVDISEFDSGQGEDLGDLAILPGLVDPHVHINEPGRTGWEGFMTATAAAAEGGIATLVDMPLNSAPVTTTVAALAAKKRAAKGKLHVDVGFHAGLIPGNEAEIPALLDAGVLGVKAFLCHSGIDDFPAATTKELRAVMPLLAERGVPLLVHAELETPVPPMHNPRRYADYLGTRPPKFERDAIALMIELCRTTGCRTHIVHLADAECLAMLQAARTEGLPITVETCPHYLTFAAEDIPDGATQFKCAPPIRDAANRESLWQGLAEGVIDMVVSDHSPCPPELKCIGEGRIDLAWGGISSLQLGLAAIWTEASRRGHTLANVAAWMCHAPSQLVGRDAGIRVGAPANLVLFDPQATWSVAGEQLHHRHPLTPYEGRTLCGAVHQTYIHGKPASAGEGRMI